MSLLEQDSTKKKREFSVLEFELSNNNKYELEAIQDSAVYAKKVDGYLAGLYYLVVWKSYSKKKNTWESSSIVMHL